MSMLSVKKITKFEKTSLGDFILHTEECQKQAFFLVFFVNRKKNKKL